ncbi:sensor histidine kinase [Halanaerobium salsuginis]|uniref:Two-component system, sensor histidine kinase YesM n=1 Tax=Halanaerobium salsuginis TaxID=29563 RepID=A0A1I4N429_9FIRM|nr:sensor histidine kinase [Halanaerobium salsuginis]SFM10238.1 two-component system, sensor histidine kinase YesM [Halanaerobium salsuginis]
MKIKKLKNKIILYFIFVTIILSLSVSFFYYYTTSNIYQKNTLKTAINDLGYIKNNVEEHISMANKFTDWFYFNSNFNNILGEDNLASARAELKLYKQIKLYITNSSLENYISSLLVIGNNGKVFKFAGDGSMIDVKDVELETWFKNQSQNSNSVYWPGLIENPAQISSYKNIIPVIRPIFDTILYKRIGWLFIGFKKSLITDIYVNNSNSDFKKYYTIDHQHNILAADENKLFFNNKNLKLKLTEMSNQDKGHFILKNKGIETLYVYQKLAQNNWTIVEKLPMTILAEQNKVLKHTSLLIFFISLLLTSLFTIYLSYNLTEPLKKIIRQVNQISLGVFDQNKHIEGQDELGILGAKINSMSESIKILMKKIVEEEEKKRKFELKALQNQINPHFLYNTLNSIKWMAIVHGNDGIKRMIVALGRLLRNLSVDTNKEIKLKEELAILDDYIYIQEIRYNGKIKFEKEIKQAELLNAQILKFILQPLVENAIFHGIEAKEKADLVKVIISRDESNNKEKNRLEIKVFDNGVGMSEDIQSKILNNTAAKHKNSLNGIGLYNVNQRIKINYGAEYGLKINSKPGEFTEIIIRLPIKFL